MVDILSRRGDELIQFLPLKKSIITQFIWPLPPPAAMIGDGEWGFPVWPLSPQVISGTQGFLRDPWCHSLLGH